MDWFARAFVKASLVWLALGVSLGVAMAVRPAWTIYRTVHLHMTLLGFVTMMIFGVGYHVLPRFVGASLWSKTLPAWHLWSSNLGLALMSLGFAVRVSSSFAPRTGTVVLSAGGLLSAAGAYLFVYNVWRTMGTGAEPLTRPAPITKRR